MDPENNPIARRNFLKIGGGGFATLASRRLWNPWSAGQTLPQRTQPVTPLVLRTSSLQLTLDSKDALPFQYELLPAHQIFRGEDFGRQIEATICNRNGWKFATIPVVVSSFKTSSNQADFAIQVMVEKKTAAHFSLRYALDRSAVLVSLENVFEERGFELIEVALPRLVTLREKDGDVWLAHADDGGSLVFLREAKTGELQPNQFWGNVMASLPVVMIGTEKALCAQETIAFMDSTILAVAGESGDRRVSMGAVQNYRVNGSLCYDMNLGKGAPRNCGNPATPNLLVGQESLCRLDFVAPGTARAIDWLDGARLVRSRMPAIPTNYYNGKYVYGIRCDEPKFEKAASTFEQCEQIIRDVAALTDHFPQIAHLWGWQYRGKDTGYPAVAEVNKRVGTLEQLRNLLAAGPKYGCRVTFSDNYDDAYKSSPAWDPKFIARRPDGELWLSRNWTGEDSYIIGLAKYMAGPGPDRVRFTCEHYGLQETIHVDVLSYFTVRNDWDPAHPASGIKNLFLGRYKVLEEFKKYGVDVTSEAMRYAAIGKISFFWHIASQKTCPFGGQPIPLQPMIYRKSAIWGEGGGNGPILDRIMNTLFYNGYMHMILRSDTDREDITDLFYLNVLPWLKIRGRDVETFHRQSDRTVIGLTGNTRVEQDWAAKTYSVVVDGVEIARNLATSCMLDDNRVAFYAQSECDLSFPMPANWKPAEAAALALFADRAEKLEFNVADGKLHVHAPARRPVIVFRDGAAARKRLIPA
jgi:hypothetical protein